jgi:hypothetical protein
MLAADVSVVAVVIVVSVFAAIDSVPMRAVSYGLARRRRRHRFANVRASAILP